MDNHSTPVPPFHIAEDPNNVGSRWEKWLNRFDNYLIAAGIDNEDRKKAMLLHYAGEEVHDLYLSFPELPVNTAQPNESPSLTAKRKLKQYFTPRVNKEFEMFNFRQARQSENETIDQFYAKLLKLSKTCTFENPNEEIKLQFIMNTKYTELRRYGLTEQPNLDDLLSRAHTIECTANQLKVIEDKIVMNTSTEECSYLNKQKKHRTAPANNGTSKNNCKNCGGKWHPNGRRACPALNVICRSCGKKGHYARVCMSTTSTQQQQAQSRANPQYNNHGTNTSINKKHNGERKNRAQIRFNELNMEPESTNSETSFKTTIRLNDRTAMKCPQVHVKLNGKVINFIVDTGSSVNLISSSTFKQFHQQSLQPDSSSILPYNCQQQLEVVGKFKGLFHYNNHQTRADVFVIKGNSESLLSYDTANKLQLIQLSMMIYQPMDMNYIKNKHPNLCNGIGCLKNQTVKLHIDESIPPVANKHRRIPINLRGAVEQEITRLMKQNIIEKATGPTPWVSPIVVVPKHHDPNSIRICVDMREANKAILRERHPTPTIEEIFAQLNGATVFSKIDLKDGYHQLTLEESSRYITVFSTHIGLYQYKRLSFGINSAAEIFQNTIRQLLNQIDSVLNISDDILIFGTTQQDHDKTLKQVIERLDNHNLTINTKKCIFNTNKIDFFGYVFSSKGIYPDPDKVKSVSNLEPPRNVHELRSFLGTLNYVGKFLPHLATNTAILRELITKDAQWDWTEKHHSAFNDLKKQLESARNLAYFDQQKKTHLYVDAGPIGLGAILSQELNNKTEVISYASRTLTLTEQKYNQIEKETLAATWAIHHFRIYLLGGHFVLHTDHKPLVSILQNPRSAPNARIERLCLKLQPYKFTVQYQRGITNPSDYLSRHPTHSPPEAYDKSEEYVAFVTNHSLPNTISLEEIENAMKDDFQLQLLKKALLEDDSLFWKKRELQTFKQIKQELTVYGNIILKGSQIVIPSKLQKNIIRLAHKGHQGLVKTKQLVRTKVWFPNINKMVEEVVKSCTACQAVTPYNQRNPIQIYPTSTHPLECLDVDYAGPFPDGKCYFIMVDDFSKFPFVKKVPSTNFKQLKPILDETFALFGLPKELKSDNGPPFNGYELKEYLSSLNIKHHLITPRWPEANGRTERFVKTFKKALLCATINSNNPDAEIQEFLINYRSTPHSTTNCPPYQIMFNREINNFLPTLKNKTFHEYNPQTDIDNRRKQNERANRKKRTFEHRLQLGQKVLCKQQKKNSLTPLFDPDPYTITRITGSQIEARRGEKVIVRNSSFFKPHHSAQSPRAEYHPSTSLAPSRSSQSEQTRAPFPTTPPRSTAPATTPLRQDNTEDKVNSPPNQRVETPTGRRPQRDRKPRSKLRDYLVEL
ncbi:hypothetical protein Zmor_011067 [Zophobas morio]|uniref:RNA-directed DNA polymerase n=1 Tax=Zophobas morio TaxID=2755281 RepID=A0AA38MKM0_9CUCU|nr:hypothetical protein Zmor_011067 [Zophobas morio]